MKKLIICALCAIFGWTAASAQKYAVVDMEYILKNIPAYERANEQLSQVSKQWQGEVDALNAEAQTKAGCHRREREAGCRAEEALLRPRG